MLELNAYDFPFDKLTIGTPLSLNPVPRTDKSSEESSEILIYY